MPVTTHNWQERRGALVSSLGVVGWWVVVDNTDISLFYFSLVLVSFVVLN